MMIRVGKTNKKLHDHVIVGAFLLVHHNEIS